MHVLSIGSDRKLFDKNSMVSLRTIEYGKKIGTICIVVFTLKSHGFETLKLSDEVVVYPTNSTSRFWYILDAIRLGKDIVFEKKFVRGEALVTCQDPFEAGFVGWRIVSKFRLPLHIQIHTDFLSPYFKTSVLQKIRVVIAKFILPQAQGVRVVSKRIASSISKAGIMLRYEPQVLPIRITTPSVVHKQEGVKLFPEFTFTTVMASRLEKEKRIEDALSAHKAILSVYPHAGLVIVGDGSQMMWLKKYAEDLGIKGSIRFLGWIDDLSTVISSADVFLSTSEYEGYGMSVIEAGLLGVPVVTTDVGIAGDILVDGENSYVCPVGDVSCITHAISELLTHNNKRHKFAMMLKKDIEQSLPSQESYVDAYIKGLRDILLRT